MEKKLKSVRFDILVVIVLLIVFNISNIIAPIGKFNILFFVLDRVIPVMYIIGFLISYNMYKSDILTASKIEMSLAIIMIMIKTFSIIAVIVLTQVFSLPALIIQIVFGYIIPIILLVDAAVMRKLA